MFSCQIQNPDRKTKSDIIFATARFAFPSKGHWTHPLDTPSLPKRAVSLGEQSLKKHRVARYCVFAFQQRKKYRYVANKQQDVFVYLKIHNGLQALVSVMLR